ncbi:unnamed protein product [Mytilus edulis]|uniref:Roc domain-containing protein n=1 Tax=Mytilus edulis TaxID=6550 RepID=A0A8S3RBL9_MYTED|nr:unnamed protein product [Mytilus edulis]
MDVSSDGCLIRWMSNQMAVLSDGCLIRWMSNGWMYTRLVKETSINNRILQSIVKELHQDKEKPKHDILEISSSDQISTDDNKGTITKNIEHDKEPQPKMNYQFAYPEITESPFSKLAKDELLSIIGSAVDLQDEDGYANLTVWDFAGDIEYYNTHQTFLNSEAIFLVVANLHDIDDTVSYGTFNFWMDTIHCYGSINNKTEAVLLEGAHNLLDPPVIAIGTHKDKFQDEEQCRKRLESYIDKIFKDSKLHLRSIHLISNTEDVDDAFEKLRNDIFATAKSTANWNREYPVKFIQMEKAINSELTIGKQIISFERLKELGEKIPLPITDNKELHLFLRYQHEIGNVIFFEDIPSYIILDPQWLANAFKCIVTAQQFQFELPHLQWDNFKKTGKMDPKLLEEIFKKQSADMRIHKEHILEVIENFLPPYLISNLIVSCLREYPLAVVKGEIGLFKDCCVFNIDRTGCAKFVLAKSSHMIQLQVWQWDEVDTEVNQAVLKVVEREINRIVNTRYKLKTVSFEKKWKCETTSFSFDTGFLEFDQVNDGENYYCEEHATVHKYKDYWSGEKSKASRRISSDQQNYVRMSMIVLEVLSGVLYDRLYIDTKTGEILDRDKLDITEMCKKYCALKINFPSKGFRKIEKVDEISTIEDTIGDDIQRIRVIRNEMQHSSVFALDDTRYQTLITIVHDMLTRFDQRNNPAGESYVKRLDEIRKMELETRSFEEIKERMKAESSDEGIPRTAAAETNSRYEWGERKTRYLIQLITDNWKKLELAYNKKPIWLDISVKLNQTLAIKKLPQDQCREKWNTLKKTNKSYKRQCSLTGNRKPRPFLFESDLDDLMLNDPSITPVLTMGSNTGAVDSEDITTNNTTERESTSSAKKSTKNLAKKPKILCRGFEGIF